MIHWRSSSGDRFPDCDSSDHPIPPSRCEGLCQPKPASATASVDGELIDTKTRNLRPNNPGLGVVRGIAIDPGHTRQIQPR